MKVFVLLSRVPWPLDKGDKLRAYHQLRVLSKNHSIHLACLADEEAHSDAIYELRKFCDDVRVYRLPRAFVMLQLIGALFSRKPFQVKYFYRPAIRRKIEQWIKTLQPDHIYCQLIRTAEYVKDIHDIPKTLDYMDTLSKGMERRIPKSRGIKRWATKVENKRLVAYENLIFDYFDFKTIISEQDRQLIYHPDRKDIVVVPNGVDLEYFQPIDRKKDFELVFHGNMNYASNVVSAEFLVERILPIVKVDFPKARLLLSGATPHQRVLNLQSDDVVVSGWVDDVRESYARSAIFIAPMQIAIGLQNKLLEAMAMGIPCITSSLAYAALGTEDHAPVLVADKPEGYAKQIADLLVNKEKRDELGKKGVSYVRDNFSWEANTRKLEEIIIGK